MPRNGEGTGGGDMLLVAAAGAAALYFLWPQISTAIGGNGGSTPASGGTPIPVTPTSPTGSPTAAMSAAEVAALQAQYQEQADLAAQNANATLPGVTSSATPINTVGLIPTRTPGTASVGIPISPRMGRMRGSAAEIAQAALNQMRADAGPQVTNNSPIGPWTPGAVALPGGCYKYGSTPVLVNCPPNTAPPPPRPAANGNCLPGYTMDASGVCARTTDQVFLAKLNSTPAGGSDAADVAALFDHISPSILGVYTSTVGIMPGSVLATMLALPANPSNGTIEQGNDGFNYQTVEGIYIRQGTATQSTRPTGPIGPRIMPFPKGTRLQGLGWLAATLPITNATLIAASNDPEIAAMVGNDPRAMLTTAQWNYFYTQASGVPQGVPPYPEIEPHALISAQQYQSWRQAAGLSGQVPKLGIIRNSRPGAFPLGGIRNGAARVPFTQPVNTNIFRIPGQGAVRLGVIQSGGGNHRSQRSPFPRPAWWRMAE